MEVPSGWLQVIRGPRPRSQQWPSAKAKDPVTTQREVPGRWRQSRGATVTSQVPKPRMSPDAAREKAQSSVARLEKALEAMGDVVGPAVEVLKAELIKARAAAKQPAVDVEIDQCRKFIARSERRIKELDSQRAEESASMTEAQERLKRLLEAQSRGPTIQPQDPGSQVTSLQQMVNTLQAERDALAQELHQARQTVEDDVQPVTKKQAVARQVSSFRDPHVPVPLMPRHVPNDVMSWLADRQAESQQALRQGDLMRVTELGKLIAEGVTHLSEITTVHPSSVSNMVTT